MKEMKKSTRSHVIRLELEGDVGKFCEALKTTKWASSFETHGDYSVDITFDPAMPMADAVKEATNLVSRCGLDLISVTSSTSSIEDAFMELLRGEESREFLQSSITSPPSGRLCRLT